MGDVQSPSHPTAIMCLSALVETEGFVCAGCGLRLKAQLAPQKGRVVLDNLCGLGLPPHTSQQTRSRQKDSHSHRTGHLRDSRL